MHWILQNNILDEEGHDQLVQALETLKIPHSIHKIIPFTTELHPPANPAEDRIICIGSYAMLRIARANQWNPGVYALQDYSHGELQEKWGARMLNQGTQTTFQDVLGTEEFEADQFFVRPATDEKFFAGQVYGRVEFVNWWEKIVTFEEDYGTGLTPKTPVLISPIREIYSEFRTWIIDGKVVTASSYKLKGTPNTGIPVDDDILDYAKECNEIWSPDYAYCLDICRTPEGLRIVEPNTINFAGFYQANVFKIIEALETSNG